MRKLIARIAILAVCSLGFIGITGAAPASAANCTGAFQTNGSGQPIWYDSGYLWFTASLINCSGISEVMIAGAPVDYYQGFWTGMLDVTVGVVHQVPRPPFADTYTFIAGSKTHFELNLGVPPWCPPATTHYVNPRYSWKIKNSAPPYQYGPWHSTSYPNNIAIWC